MLTFVCFSLLLIEVTCAVHLWDMLLVIWASVFKNELLVMLSESKIWKIRILDQWSMCSTCLRCNCLLDWNHISSECTPAWVSQLSLIIFTIPSLPNKPGESRKIQKTWYFDIKWILTMKHFVKSALISCSAFKYTVPFTKCLSEMGSRIVLHNISVIN